MNPSSTRRDFPSWESLWGLWVGLASLPLPLPPLAPPCLPNFSLLLLPVPLFFLLPSLSLCPLSHPLCLSNHLSLSLSLSPSHSLSLCLSPSFSLSHTFSLYNSVFQLNTSLKPSTKPGCCGCVLPQSQWCPCHKVQMQWCQHHTTMQMQ